MLLSLLVLLLPLTSATAQDGVAPSSAREAAPLGLFGNITQAAIGLLKPPQLELHVDASIPLGIPGLLERQPWAPWKDGKMSYTLGSSLSSSDKNAINNAMKHIEQYSCIRFSPVPKPSGTPTFQHLMFEKWSKGYCYTSWSTISGGGMFASINLDPNALCMEERTIIHEIFHAMMFYHTHTRPDRDQYVTVNMENVYAGVEREFNICSGCCCNTWNVPYDCDSVMHYAKDQFSKNGKDTITAKSSRCRLLSSHDWNNKRPMLSAWDKDIIDRMYGGLCGKK